MAAQDKKTSWQVQGRPRSSGICRSITLDPTLGRYFQDLALHSVFDAEAEAESMKRMSQLEVERWRVLLGEPALAGALSDVIRDQFMTGPGACPPPDLRPLKRAATRARGTANARYLDVVSRLSPALLDADPDREIVAAAHESALARAAAGSSRRARCFAAYAVRVRAALAEVERAKHEFIRANLRLVVVIARRYDKGKLPLIDLIQEGNLGLIKAVNRFDRRYGCRFSTYASWWIRHAIGRAIATKGQCVRVPVHTLETQRRLARVEASMARRLGRAPTPEELSDETGLHPGKLAKVARHRMASTCSLDGGFLSVDDRRYGDLLADEEHASPFDETLLAAWRDKMGAVLGTLTPIERSIITSRYGLADDNVRTLKEIGALCNLSRERVRQLQEQALRKMRDALDIDAA
ncbi:MAG: sigma-70 family RNA polymerase sigma factor [Deltaproteobacteria bacterium]|nr:sigma-70 family RNA polymerase sigma factor [Deltaproteobacteria bacterium]